MPIWKKFAHYTVAKIYKNETRVAASPHKILVVTAVAPIAPIAWHRRLCGRCPIIGSSPEKSPPADNLPVKTSPAWQPGKTFLEAIL